jgi:hypothetical protein
MENNENFVTEVTENVEQTTEETVAEPAKMFTQEDLNAAVGKAKARERAKITKQYERKYGDLEAVLKAGTGKESVEEMTDTFTNFYESKGIKIEKPSRAYSEKEISVLAKADAEEIISGGYDEVVEEVDRLAQLGVSNMTDREKAVFHALATHREQTERSRALAEIGVTEDVYNSKEFTDFAKQFNPNIPIKDVYDIYAKTQPRKEHKSMGSMKQVQGAGAKDYYTPEEIERLTEEDLDDPKVWAAVRRSMTGV